MTFVKPIALILSLLFMMMQAHADQAPDLTHEKLEQIFNQEIMQLTPEQQNQLLKADAMIQHQLGFVQLKSSGTPSKRVPLVCLQAKIPLVLLAGGGSICRTGGNKSQFFVIGKITAGAGFQWMAGGYAGYVQTSTRITGLYEVLSIGVSAGLAADVLFGKSENSRKLFLIGLGAGFGVELTGGSLYLQSIFAEN